MQNHTGILKRQDAASTNIDTIGYFDPNEPVADLLGNLPHWRQEAVTYFVTVRLADSIPQKIKLWLSERDEWLRRNPEPHGQTERQEYYRLFIERLHKWMDAGYGECLLARPDIRKIVVDAMEHFDGERYLLREWVVMPNHVHVIFTPLADYQLSKIIHSWKSFSSKQINKHLGRQGIIWQKESFDHIVRNPDQLERMEHYIHNNPHNLSPNTFTLHCIH